MFAITVSRQSISLRGGFSFCSKIHSRIFWNLSRMSNLMLDCSFRRQTGQSSRGFLADYYSWFDPFIRHSKKMQCLIPNICDISCVITPAALQNSLSQFISNFSSLKNRGSYLANENTPVLSLMLASPNTKFHSSLGYRSVKVTPIRQNASGGSDFCNLTRISLAFSCYFSVCSLTLCPIFFYRKLLDGFSSDILRGQKKHSQYPFSFFRNSTSMFGYRGLMQIVFFCLSTMLCICPKQASQVWPYSSWSQSQSLYWGL